jgi:3-oxoacyl-[acyl-carrier protein] reductase
VTFEFIRFIKFIIFIKLMVINRFEDMQVWKQARNLVRAVYEISNGNRFSKDFGLRNQITRAAVSIMSNIAEGFERKSNNEFIQYLFVAKGSAGELRSQLYAAYDLKYIDDEKFNELLISTEQISKSLSGFIKYLKKSNLKNRVAVITGAGKGIGRAAAELFLKEGARVVLVSRTKSDLDNFGRKFSKYKKIFLCITANVSKDSAIKLIIQRTIKTFGTIDILINNAGFGKFAELVKSKTKDFDDMFATNVRAVYLMTKGFLPYMIKKKSGTIINISSMAGKQGFATGTGYCATKHAVMGFSRALLLEVRKFNIRVISICPGSVDTQFFRKESHTTLASSKDTILKAQDIAEACLFASTLPQNAMVSELDIRPTNPRY